MSDLLSTVAAAAAELERSRHAHRAVIARALRSHSSREVARAAGMSHEGVRNLVATEARREAKLRQRLDVLDGRWSELVNQLAETVMPADPQRQQAYRNGVNGQIRKSQAGRNRDGRARGTVGKHRGKDLLPTVRAEARAVAEAKVLRCLANDPGDPIFLRIAAELAEASELRARLEQLAEARLDF